MKTKEQSWFSFKDKLKSIEVVTGNYPSKRLTKQALTSLIEDLKTIKRLLK